MHLTRAMYAHAITITIPLPDDHHEQFRPWEDDYFEHDCGVNRLDGAGAETRTRTGFPPGDFKSPVSTNSTTPAMDRYSTLS
jgi:hypothetical protein